MRLLCVSHAATTEGAERVLAEAAAGLAGRGVEVEVVLPGEGPLGDLLAGQGAAVRILPHRPWTRGGRLPRGRGRAWRENLRRAVPAIRQRLEAWPADVVMTNTLTVPAGALACRGTGVPHVWYVHELMDPAHGLRFDLGRSLSLRLVDRLSRRILVNSSTTRDAFAGVFPAGKVDVIEPAVPVPDLPAGDAPPGPELRCIVVGNLREGKRQEEAIRAAARLQERGVPVRLTLLGDEDPSYGRTLRGLAADLQLTGAVRFLPHVPDPFPEMAAAHVVVVCSRQESFGRVVVEGMKLGRPVVGADSGGVAGLLRESGTGRLYRPGDADDLARALEDLHRDPEERERLGREGRAWARGRFTPDRFTDALLTALDRARAAGGSA
ncbi:MAG: glycosyltransferase family 4 protein [Acidobacteriota bacterium]|jgi:glycosyltransferase involved in cell wall biosynthesis